MSDESEIDVVALTAERDDMAGRLNGLVETLADLGYPLPAEGEATNHAVGVISALKADNADLTKKVEAAKAKAKAVPSEKKGRKIGPMKDAIEGRDDENGRTSAEGVLLEQIRDAETVEVAFSDGKNELAGAPAVVVSGEGAWAITAAGLKLTIDPLMVYGAAAPFEIRGYGLILDGKQVAWRETEAKRVLPGANWNLSGDVVFTG